MNAALIQVESVLDLVAAVYPPDEFLYDLHSPGERDAYEGDIWIAPCVRGLPYETTITGEVAPRLKVAGVAGGVGTTLLARVLDADDCGQECETADVIVARNDYRCAHALVALAPRPDQKVVVVVEPSRALTPRDIEDALGRPVIVVDWTPAVARADDAGLLNLRRSSLEHIRRAVLGAS